MVTKKELPRRRSFALADERHGLSLRVSRRVREQLEAASRMSGRSLSQEAELRLESALQDERSFRDNLDYVFGRQGSAVLQMIGFLMREEGDWLDDASAFEAMRYRIHYILKAVGPPETPPVEDPKILRAPRQLLQRLFAQSPDPVWFRWSIELRERLGPAVVARVGKWLAARQS
jgi:hypothetical protein